MKLSRKFSLIFHFIFDELTPPILRDNRFFMKLIMKLAFGKGGRYFYEFKERLPHLSDQELQEYYERSAPFHIDRPTDLNGACIAEIETRIAGQSVLDIACGRGFLANKLSGDYNVTGADFVISEEVREQFPHIQFDQQNIEKLDYEDNQFDTVICTHTLEHVRDPKTALSELRRVSKSRLIIVLPRQRAYQYTFDLHIHFFYYRWQVQALLSGENGIAFSSDIQLVGGNWFIIEDMTN